jgi:hypothetical protein
LEDLSLALLFIFTENGEIEMQFLHVFKRKGIYLT